MECRVTVGWTVVVGLAAAVIASPAFAADVEGGPGNPRGNRGPKGYMMVLVDEWSDPVNLPFLAQEGTLQLAEKGDTSSDVVEWKHEVKNGVQTVHTIVTMYSDANSDSDIGGTAPADQRSLPTGPYSLIDAEPVMENGTEKYLYNAFDNNNNEIMYQIVSDQPSRPGDANKDGQITLKTW